MKVKIKIQSWEDRNSVVIALANNGYAPIVEVAKNLLEGDTYYVVFEYKN